VTGYKGSLETVFGRGLVVTGIAMFTGSVLGGVIAQATNLGVPFLLRAAVLVLMFVFAFLAMHDLGFTPDKSMGPIKATRNILAQSIEHGMRKRSVRYVILSAPFASGVGIYAFYALQPYLLELYGDPTAYSIAGLAAAILSLAQVAGGLLAPRLRRLFAKRTTTVIVASLCSIVVLVALGLTAFFWFAVVLLVIWGFVFAVAGPVRQAYLNDMIPSKQRATVLSFDSLFGSLGGVIIQPGLGRAADLWGYGTSLVIGGAIELIGIPFLLASRRQGDPADMAGAPGAAGDTGEAGEAETASSAP
jgi:predicted MFS family arabinose efflux permease